MHPIAGDLIHAASHPRYVWIPEAVVFTLAATALNVTGWADDPGFTQALINPYLVVVVLIAGRYGIEPGLSTAAASVIASAATFGVVRDTSPFAYFLSAPGALASSSLIGGAFAVGWMAVWHRGRLALSVKRHQRARERIEALEREYTLVNEEKSLAEKRVLSDEGTFLALVSMFDDLDRLDPDEIPERLLRVVRRVMGGGVPALYQPGAEGLTRELGDEAMWPAVLEPKDEPVLAESLKRRGRASVADVHVAAGARPPDRVLVAAPLLHEDPRFLVIGDLHFIAFAPERMAALDGCLAIAARAHERATLFAGTHDRNVVDPITGACTLAFFDKRLREEMALARRHKLPLSVLTLADPALEAAVDAAARDERRRALADALKAALRDGDLLAHHGAAGHFAILCPLTPASGAKVVAERLSAKLGAGVRVTTLAVKGTQVPEHVLEELAGQLAQAGAPA